MERKLALVKKHREEYGLNRCLRALSVSKSTWHRHQRRPEVSEKDKELKTKVTKVVEEHPAYGYRRIKVELEESYGTVVNHKRLRRCLREWDLALKRQVARPWPSGVRVILKEEKGKLNLPTCYGTESPSRLRCCVQTLLRSGTQGVQRKRISW